MYVTLTDYALQRAVSERKETEKKKINCAY